MANMTKNTDSWFHNISKNRRVALRLFCFPYAGGAASIYQSWAEHLPSTIQIVPVELPGRGRRLKAPLVTSIPALIDELLSAIPPFLDAPFAFFGHSMGAVIAYELARGLQRRSRSKLQHLFVSGRRAPQIPDTDPIRHDLPRKELIKELHQINGTPEEALENRELMDIMIPILRADFQMIQTYKYLDDAPLACPITAYGGLEDDESPVELLYPWADQTCSNFNLRMLPGNHFFIRSSQSALLELLAAELHNIIVCSRSSSRR